MEPIIQVLKASIAPVNLPFTILLALVVLYWLSVVLGFFDLETGDSWFDMDASTDGSASSGSHGDGHGGWFHSFMHFLHIGEVPLMAVLSLLILCLWAFSVMANHYFNPGGSLLLGMALLIPNLFLSVVLASLLVKPLKPLFQALNKDYDRHEPIIGQVCEITTSEVNDHFGMGRIDAKGAPITIQVRMSNGETLRRGDRALVIGEDKAKSLYQVVKYQEPKVEA